MAGERPAACRSARKTVTASTVEPSGSTSRHGAHGSPVSRSEPACATTRLARSRGDSAPAFCSITSPDRSDCSSRSVGRAPGDLPPDLLGHFK